MKDLLSKFKPVLKKEGVFYSAPQIKEKTDVTIVLEEVYRKAKFGEEYLNNKGKVLGFSAWHKLTGEHYYIESLVSKKVGKPGIFTVIKAANNLQNFCFATSSAIENEPVDYAKTLDSALYRAHDYIFNKILDEVLHPDDVYVNLLDTTKIGLEKFKERENNKANLSEQRKEDLGHARAYLYSGSLDD